MKRRSKLLSFILLFVISFSQTVPVLASTNFYTYLYDYWGIERESPDAYKAEKIYFGRDIGVGDLRDPQGLFVRGEKIYIADSGNNRVIECDANFKLIRVIDKFMLDGAESTLRYPTDVYVTENNDIYIADSLNQRVVGLDYDLNVLKVITKPTDSLLSEISDFLPLKLVVDNADRLYLLARNVNQGIMEFDGSGSFTGYVGANKVTVNMVDYLWKTVSTQAQREQMALFVPTEYNNLSLDSNGFIYTTTGTLADASVRRMITTGSVDSDTAPVRRLNSMGIDILVRNGFYPPVGDIDFNDQSRNVNIGGSSKFIDVVPLESDSYCAIDKVRGRVFAYDFQGNLLYAFGGLGNKLGYFQQPTAIENIDESLLVLDSRSGGITRFDLTEFGNFINESLLEYKRGNYDLSADKWREVLKFNSNYDLAYIGIGRSLLRQGFYKEAMDYFDLKFDTINYSKAFQMYRKQVIEENIGLIFGGIIGLYVLVKAIKMVRRVRRVG